jgi:hypothetical protein
VEAITRTRDNVASIYGQILLVKQNFISLPIVGKQRILQETGIDKLFTNVSRI